MTDAPPPRDRPFPPPELEPVLARLARTATLLVASDFDGTLAPIVDNPDDARPLRESIVALKALAGLPHTQVAVISGRALKDLGAMVGETDELHLVGSHGSEFDVGFARSLAPARRELLARVRAELDALAAAHPGAQLEPKPASVALHYRHVDRDRVAGLRAAIHEGAGAWDGVTVKDGKEVVELSVVATSKGDALDLFRSRIGATGVLFLGDDVTDEDAFERLRGPDVGVKIGAGDTAAAYRLDDPYAVARLLADLSERRADWAAGAEAVPIETLSYLSDQRAAALVAPDGTVPWLCAPRVDAPPLFASLLGGAPAGYFRVAPVAPEAAPTARYRAGSLVLETDWGALQTTDYMDLSDQRAHYRAGRTDLVRVVAGRGRVRIEFAPRIDFGRVPTRLSHRGDAVVVEDTLEPVVLYAPGVAFAIHEDGPHQTATAEVELGGAPLVLDLRFGTANVEPSVAGEPARRQGTEAHWRDWLERLELPRTARDLVGQSALVLKGLCYGPTGGILAAATTSLPETIGGIRNWDYRYVWLRDGAMAATALARLGSPGEGFRFLDWIMGVLDRLESPEALRPLYTVSGHNLGSEAEIGELMGYAGSGPVRIGNAAAYQVQLDVFGPIVELIATLLEVGAPVTHEHWRVTQAMVEAVERRWREPDHGIWEVRDQRRHYTHSKVMCWLSVDRALVVAERLMNRDQPAWRELRDEIAADVLEHAWRPALNAFAADYERDEIDAAVLAIGLSGLVAADDPRFVGTVEAVERELRRGPTVDRYRYDDGLPGREGGFHLCTSWLIEALLRIGRVADAQQLFGDLCGLAGPTGLLSEEYDPEHGRALGNHPQAYSHLGLIANALHLDALATAALKP